VSLTLSTAMFDRPSFESVEGLRGTGKSTLAPLLAAARGGVLVASVPLIYQSLRREIDERDNADARMCFYLSALLTASDQINQYLKAGTPVVVDSYFERCLATHEAFGARTTVELPSDLPRPTAYYLICDETERRRRLAGRNKPVSRWDAREDLAPERTVGAYRRFPMTPVDTTRSGPEELVEAILGLTARGDC
jgi:hypothetical protein